MWTSNGMGYLNENKLVSLLNRGKLGKKGVDLYFQSQ